MGISSLALRCVASDEPETLVEWQTTSMARPRVLEISAQSLRTSSVTRSLGLGRPEESSYNPTRVAFQPADSGDRPSLVTGAVEWQVMPLAPLVYLRRTAFGTDVSVVWSFPFGLLLISTGTLVIYQTINSGSQDTTLDATCVVDE